MQRGSGRVLLRPQANLPQMLRLLILALSAFGTRASLKRSCPLACENGGHCLPTAAAVIGRDSAAENAWSCICPWPWNGPTCGILAQQAEDDVTQSLEADSSLAAEDTAVEQKDLNEGALPVDLPPGQAPDVELKIGLGSLRHAAEEAAWRRKVHMLAGGNSRGAADPAASPAGGSPAASPAAGSPPASSAAGSSAGAASAKAAAEANAAARAKASAAAAAADTEARKVGSTKDKAAMPGVKQNSPEGLGEFIGTVTTTGITVLACFAWFCIFRTRFALVYEGEAEPDEVSKTWFGWMYQSWNLTLAEIEREAGLDHAMFIEFIRLSLRILLRLGIPLFGILAPCHFFLGGDAAGDNKLSWFAVANVKAGSDLFWLHAVAVWYVVVIVMTAVYNAEKKFMPLRAQWLKDMETPRCNTVYVEDLPEGYWTDAKVKEYFDEGVFGRQVVKKVNVLKQTTDLIFLQKRLQKIQDAIQEAQAKSMPTDVLKDQQKAALENVKVERKKVLSSDEHNLPLAFVEFYKRRDKVIAVKIFSAEDNEEIIVSPPPDIPDIVWDNINQDPTLQVGKDLTGKALIVGLFFAFMPLVLFIQSVGRIEEVSKGNPLYIIQENHPGLIIMWNGLVGSLALSVLMGLIPPVLTMIFEAFFKMADKSHTQLLLQQWYFTFLIIFVVLVTAVGNSLFATLVDILKKPDRLIWLLARTLPYSTHFYLCYMAVQWGVEGLALVRIAQLVKFAAFLPVFGSERAKELVEPEDQAAQGIGARSARLSLLLVVPLVFCTLAPSISLISLVNFALARLVYSYLFQFAETTKGDSGGIHWSYQLKSVQASLVIFIVLMTGVLFERKSWVCGGIAASSGIYWKYMFDKGLREFKLDVIGFTELRDMEADLGVHHQMYEEMQKRFQSQGAFAYRQPELDADDAPKSHHLLSRAEQKAAQRTKAEGATAAAVAKKNRMCA
mmetsp:Transcript_137449/g.439097  ORF Transcript_137449/g.439097 Transcript_137449/m.439097 type:complete len:953 (+) Transcript_137449:94-2952(+)